MRIMNTDNAISLGNLMYAKEYGKVIVEGQKMLRENPHDAGVHVSLMDAFYKLRDTNPTYLDQSTEHARLAIIYGHDTGYAHKRLAMNLMNTAQYHKALQLCDMVMMPEFSFSTHGCGKVSYFGDIALRAMKKLSKATDSPKDVLFTKKQIDSIISMTKKHKEREAEAREVLKAAGEALDDGRMSEHKRLMNKYHRIQASL